MARGNSYLRAVQWIADYDESAETDPVVMADLISVSLVADVWDKQATQVARDVLKVRAARSARPTVDCDGRDFDNIGESPDF